MRFVRHCFYLPLSILLSSCTVVHSTLGGRIDTWGKETPEARLPRVTTPTLYRLEGCVYMPLEVHYRPAQQTLIQCISHTLKNGTQNTRWPEKLPTDAKEIKHYLFPLSSAESGQASTWTHSDSAGMQPIAAEHFPFHRASAQQATKLFVPESAQTTPFFSFTLHDSEGIIGIPSKRSTGNYTRIPMAALIAWGVDLPLSIAATVTLTAAEYTIAAACLPLAIPAVVLFNSNKSSADAGPPKEDPPPRTPIPPDGSDAAF